MGSRSDKLALNRTHHLQSGSHSGEVGDAAGKLNRLAELAHEFSSERIEEEAKNLAQRLMEGRFYVACIGQFKRG